METEVIKHDPYAVLRIAEYRKYIITRFLVTIAVQIQSVAVGWQVYQLTRDPLSLGFIGLVEAIPSISVSLYAGHVADRSNRKKIILTCLSVYFICCLLLFLFTVETARVYTGFSIYHIYTVIFISGIARGFLGPAFFGFMSQLVPRQLYPNSAVWGSTVMQLALVSGPAMGGLIYGFFSVSHTYLTSTVLLLIAITAISLIKRKPTPVPDKKESLMESLSTGLKFVFKNQVILGALSLDLFAVLFGGAVALLPVFADEILNTGPRGLGILRASPALGAIIMSWFMAHYPKNEKAGRNLLLAVACFGICMILFALSRNFYFSMLMLMLSGMFDNVSVVIRSTIIQTMTPDNMRGRVSSVNSMFIGSSNEIGSFESGVAAKLIGTVPSVIFGGCMTLLVVGITGLRADKLRGLNLNQIVKSEK